MSAIFAGEKDSDIEAWEQPRRGGDVVNDVDAVTAPLLAAFAELFRTLYGLQRQQPDNNVLASAIADADVAWNAFMAYVRQEASS